MLLLLLSGCSSTYLDRNPSDAGLHSDRLQNSYTVPVQTSPPEEIQSVQIYRSGSPSNPPVLTLRDDGYLILEFDYMGSDARQFTVSLRHYSRTWEQSPLNPEFYIDGFPTDFIGSGAAGLSESPPYRHYRYELPNARLSPTVSGNYLLLVHDSATNTLLFSVPFFVSENEGTLRTRVETVMAPQAGLGENDLLISEYRYPPFIDFPGFDLSYYYVQNHFWGRARSVRQWDTSSPGLVYFRLSREDAFPGDYEFRYIDLRSFTPGGRILSFEPEHTPPHVVLRRDQSSFPPAPAIQPGTRFGLPLDNRSARYAEVLFRLEENPGRVDSSAKIHLTGDFNGWEVDNSNRMKYNSATGLWEGISMIKQGEYAYKYVLVEDNNRINDLAFDQQFMTRRQSYTTFVYFRDPARHYDRLLQVEEFIF